MAAPTAVKLRVQVWVGWGDTDGSTENILNFTEASSTTGNMGQSFNKKYAASASDQQIDLSTFCTTATWIYLRDLGGTGLNVALDATATAKFQIAANGFLLFKNRNATPPTLFITNPSGAASAYAEVGILGSQS
jgi:hypothetical protein